MPGVMTAHNPDWATGMGSSLAVGLAAVPVGCTAAVLALADQPLVGAQSVRRLIAAYADGASVAVACYDGKPRNPVLIGRQHWPDVIRLADGDVGARPFLRAHPELVTWVDCSDTGRPDDIDTPDDLDRIERLLAHRTPLPS
jgi:nicotine blue oxidoreductase